VPNSGRKGKTMKVSQIFTYLKAKTNLASQVREIHCALAEDFWLSCGMEGDLLLCRGQEPE